MNTLFDKLEKLETQLQALIEQGALRMSSKGGQQNQISTSLVKAMQDSAKVDQVGRFFAADTYILIFNKDTARKMGEDESIKQQFEQVLVAAAEHSGLYFQASPRVKISVDDGISPGRFEILASFSVQELAKTSTLTVDPGGGLHLPGDAFLIIHGNEVITLNEQTINIGRRSDNEIVIDNPQVSRKHAQLRVINNRFVIFDLGSKGGTFVNKVRVEQASLFPGDVISLAGVDLVYGQDAGFRAGDSGSSTQPMMPILPDENRG